MASALLVAVSFLFARGTTGVARADVDNSSGKNGNAVSDTPSRGESPDATEEVKDEKLPAEEDKIRTDYDQNCLRSGCHARLLEASWVHGPVAVGACEMCHEPKGQTREHTFQPSRPKEGFCAFCHELPKPQESVHQAVSDHDCTGCHDPHGGANRALLVTLDEGKLCGKCHAADRPESTDGTGAGTSAFKVLHEPVAEGKCRFCHQSHQSHLESLLVRPERALCLSCHESVKNAIASASHVHQPMSAECKACHAAHGTEHPHLLTDTPKALCLSCHDAIVQQLKGPGVHGAMKEQGSCLQCHDAHAGDTPKLVVTPIRDACLACHDRKLGPPDGRQVRNVKAEIDSSQHKHGPVATGDCGVCHLSHGSSHPALLTQAYPLATYALYSESAYTLCFACHDRRLATEARSQETGFRDGGRNLHHLHVNRKKGRTCSLCHTSHGSDLPKQMRRETPFGPSAWRLPIGFKKTKSGGSCNSGCHGEESYDSSRAPPIDGGTSPPSRPQHTPRE